MNKFVENLITECVPGGSSCDPQEIADSIREYFSKENKENERVKELEVINQKLSDAASELNRYATMLAQDLELRIGNVEPHSLREWNRRDHQPGNPYGAEMFALRSRLEKAEVEIVRLTQACGKEFESVQILNDMNLMLRAKLEKAEAEKAAVEDAMVHEVIPLDHPVLREMEEVLKRASKFSTSQNCPVENHGLVISADGALANFSKLREDAK